jgi:hypothetical protein
MQVSEQDLVQACEALNKAQEDLCRATLRLRALKGEALFKTGDSFNCAATQTVMEELGREFGSRNLRMF